jgi:hypothetical protein
VFGRNHAFWRDRANTFKDAQMSNPLAATHAAPADQIASQVKTWLEAGIPLVIPGDQFRALLPMGTTFFYGEINRGRLRAVKHAGKACVPIEEAARYKSSLPALCHAEAT